MRITKQMIDEQNNQDKERLEDLATSLRRYIIYPDRKRTCQVGSPVANEAVEYFRLLNSLLELGGINKSEYNKQMKLVKNLGFEEGYGDYLRVKYSFSEYYGSSIKTKLCITDDLKEIYYLVA